MFLQIGKILKKEKGTAALEFSIIVAPLVILIFAIFEFGIFFNNWISLTFAAREAVRLAAVGVSEEAIRAKINSIVPNGSYTLVFLDKNQDPIDLTDAIIGETVTVKVTGKPVDLNIPNPDGQNIVLNSIVLTGSATLLIENTE
jgi:Flp pilus assembly protein TadG